MIGFYIHHHGWGHRVRAGAIARRLPGPVVGFSTLPGPDDWPGEWVRLADDWTAPVVEPTAGGAFHWAPVLHPGHRDRLGVLAARLGTDLTAMVVDTSAEITVLARLFGVPTVLVALRGQRRDRPHRAGFAAADLILATLPATAPAQTRLDARTTKTVFTGAISRFDHMAVPERPSPAPNGPRRVLVLWGAGGRTVTPGQIQAADAVTPGWQWVLRTPEFPSPDLWRDLTRADVVVTHAGDSAVAEIAAARAPAVVIAQPRPFGEQKATTRALGAAGCCVTLDRWPEAAEWPDLLLRASRLGGAAWGSWNPGTGALHAARAIEDLVRCRRLMATSRRATEGGTP